MASVGKFLQLPGSYPAVGYLQRVRLMILTAFDVATHMRLIIVSKKFNDNSTGYSQLKSERWCHVWDSDANGTPSLAVSAGVPVDRIFPGQGVPYQSYDYERNVGAEAGVPDGNGKMTNALYAYLEWDGAFTVGSCRVLVSAVEGTTDPQNIPYIGSGGPP